MEYSKVCLNSARNCLRYIIKTFSIKEIYLPYYLCPVMRISALKEGCSVKFYHIDNNFMPVENFQKESYVLYPNYFGICRENVLYLSEKYKNLIVDNAHSFFSKPVGIASFNSVRKFFPKIRDGAFLYIKSDLLSSIKKSDYFYEMNDLSQKEFYLNESRIDKEDVMLMSDVSMRYFSGLDIENVKLLLRQKFDKLNNQYIDINLLKINISENDIPYKYPLLLDNSYIADKFVEKLNSEGKEIFKYWDNLPQGFPEKIFREQLVAV